MCIYHILFTHSSVNGNLGCFGLLVIMNNADNMGIKIPPWVLTLYFFAYLSQSGIARSYGNLTFNFFLWKHHIVFHSGYAIFHFQYSPIHKVPISPHPHQHLLFSMYLIIAILMGVKYYLIVILNSIHTHPHTPSCMSIIIKILNKMLGIRIQHI